MNKKLNINNSEYLLSELENYKLLYEKIKQALTEDSLSDDKSDITDEEPEHKIKSKGRPKGTHQKTNKYIVLYYDIQNLKFISLGEFKSFEDIAQKLKTKYHLNFTSFQISNYYSKKTSNQFIQIKHI